jgi:hypothetical protein
MEVFLSWSGERSGAIAAALRDWLPKVLQSVRPWMSQTDISKGTKWDPAISAQLERAKAGIFCLTPSNLNNKSILFEAGAISKRVNDSRVYTLLSDIEPANLEWPLAQFQATSLRAIDIKKMVADINGDLANNGEASLPDESLREALSVWWPKLEEQIQKLPSDSLSVSPKRTEKDLLEEVLELVRGQARMANRYEELLAFITHARDEENAQRERYTMRVESLYELLLGLRDELTTTAEQRQFLMKVRDVAAEALRQGGQDTAAALLKSGKWTYRNGHIVVEVTVKKTMLALTMNGESLRIICDVLKPMNIGPKMIVIPQASSGETTGVTIEF